MASMPSLLSSMAGMKSLNSLNTPSGLPKFVTSLPEKCRCIKCRNLLRNAMQTSCGHRLCEPCAQEMFTGVDPGGTGEMVMCPAGEDDCEKQTPGSLYPDGSARRDVLKLVVYCEYHDFGCKAKMMWKELQEHMVNCEYVPTECKNKSLGCAERIPKISIREHETSLCQYRPVGCQTCGEMFPQLQIQNHEANECPKTIITCPHNCGMASFPREQLEEHYNSCPARPVKCEFAKFGCMYEGSLQSIEHHLQESMHEHLKMLLQGVKQKDSIINELRVKSVELENEVDMLKARVTEKEKLTTSLSDKVNDSQQKLRNLQKMVAKQSDEIARIDSKSTSSSSLSGDSQVQLDRQAADILQVQEKQGDQEQRLARVERGGGRGAASSDPVKSQVQDHGKQLGLLDMRLAEHDLRFQVVETASYDGVLIWKIRDYARRRQEAIDGRTYSLYSQPFYTSRYGYKMCARVYLNGDGMGKNTHLSLFFVVMRGEYDALLAWPFRQKVTLQMIDQESGRNTLSDSFRPDPASSSFKRPTSNMNIASGCPMFVSQSVLHGGKYIKDDTIFIKVLVDTSDLYIP